jgi:transposase
MRGQLSRETRLEISVTRLKSGIKKVREENVVLKLQLKEKDRTIKELQAKLVDKESQRKELLSYLYKPGKKDEAKKPIGKKLGSPAYHRPPPKEESVTQEYTYTVKQCPICKEGVGGVVDTVVKYTEDIDLKPRPLVTKHTITRHWCKHCETYVKSADIPPISRIGTKTLGYILYARYRLRLPMEKIQESLSDLYNFKISQGEISEKLKEAQELFGKDYEAIIVLIQEAKVVYADETGWRMNGKNWYLWVFVTAKGIQYVIEDTRGKGVAERALGEKMDRVIISDGYTAYQNLPGDKQQCWVHLLRKAKLHSPTLYVDLVLLYKKLLLELEKPHEQRSRKKFEDDFLLLIKKKYPEQESHKIQERMDRHKHVLFTCLSYDGVLPENNTAERAIRPQVVMRKIFGGSRSLAGVKTHQVNTSVLETMRKQNPESSFFEVIVPLLNKRRSEL